MKTKAWLVLVLLVGCSAKKDETAAQRAACTAAVERAVSTTLERRLKSGTMVKADAKKLVDELGPKLKVTLAELCATDQWPDTVVSCFQTATDISGCKDRLKPEQRQKYTQEMLKVMRATTRN